MAEGQRGDGDDRERGPDAGGAAGALRAADGRAGGHPRRGADGGAVPAGLPGAVRGPGVPAGSEREFALGFLSSFAPMGTGMAGAAPMAMGPHAAGAGAFGTGTAGMGGAMGMAGQHASLGGTSAMAGYGPAGGAHGGGLFGAMASGGGLSLPPN
ncbi:MAG: hypothetical protein OXQ29_05605 [Rhodospirillaceae bacterium]|nr:hypothetical protein [Rhodospirillaceae bacterium]